MKEIEEKITEMVEMLEIIQKDSSLSLDVRGFALQAQIPLMKIQYELLEISM